MGKEHLEPIKEYTHPESRKPYTKLTSDRLRWFHAKSRESGSFVKPTNPKKYEAEIFALEIANKIEASRTAGLFHRLILVAPLAFYGLLK
ncbi:host attachment protein [Candidatus Coxiella mudrowiae]|uniref:host attachment protein n=1 Tax=Candidatus Coxiella mudrowiae TaxID=2054173 RepID=UPI001FD4344F|nr:host attachment protein [Candidatus Coxiella mudrowiae]